jgi:hypothetical protein
MEERCDQVADCRDESDENGCQLLVRKPSYNKLVPPITTVSGTNKTIVPAPVTVSVVLMKIVGIEETRHKIDMQLEIILDWKENDRVQFQNLKHNAALNALPEQDFRELWLPRVIYANTDQKETTRLGNSDEWSTSVTVKREGGFTRSENHVVDEIDIFSGNKNTLTMQQTYTQQFQCKYHLHRYPFDTQVAGESQLDMFPSPELLHRGDSGESRPGHSEAAAR